MPRYSARSVVINETKLWVTGGGYLDDGSFYPLDSSEFIEIDDTGKVY